MRTRGQESWGSILELCLHSDQYYSLNKKKMNLLLATCLYKQLVQAHVGPPLGTRQAVKRKKTKPSGQHGKREEGHMERGAEKCGLKPQSCHHLAVRTLVIHYVL